MTFEEAVAAINAARTFADLTGPRTDPASVNSAAGSADPPGPRTDPASASSARGFADPRGPRTDPASANSAGGFADPAGPHSDPASANSAGGFAHPRGPRTDPASASSAGGFDDLAGPRTDPASVFVDGGDSAAAVGEPVEAYRRLSKIVHPDAAPATESARATEAFAKLSALWAAFRSRGPSGDQADRSGGLSGDIADLVPHDGGRALRKVPRLPGDNDLMTAEAVALRTLWTDGDPQYRAYAPRLIASTRDGRKRVNVIERLHGFVTLAEVLRRRPDGIDARDTAWMWRRLLTGLGWAHRVGVVHGAVLPAHVLIHPEEHGVVLVDWCYSVATGTPLTALVAQHRTDYPPEALAKQPATPATDIYLATVLMRRLIRRPPAPIARFLDGCLYDAPRMRPQDAWALLAELDEVLFACFGPRKFRPFTL